MSCTRELSDELRARGFRVTPQRHTIMHVLKSAGTHFSPARVYEEARKSMPGMTGATVYRTLEFLAENGVVLPTLDSNRHIVYEIARHDHHHVVCSSCGKSVEIDHKLLRGVTRQLEGQSGYQLTVSHLSFFGLCPACQKKVH